MEGRKRGQEAGCSHHVLLVGLLQPALNLLDLLSHLGSLLMLLGQVFQQGGRGQVALEQPADATLQSLGKTCIHSSCKKMLILQENEETVTNNA